jgi:hypothetical protein
MLAAVADYWSDARCGCEHVELHFFCPSGPHDYYSTVTLVQRCDAHREWGDG